MFKLIFLGGKRKQFINFGVLELQNCSNQKYTFETTKSKNWFVSFLLTKEFQKHVSINSRCQTNRGGIEKSNLKMQRFESLVTLWPVLWDINPLI